MSAPSLVARYTIASGSQSANDDPAIFPLLTGQNFLASKQPVWSTQIATSVSGRERRRKQWSYPKWHFKVTYEVLRDQVAYPDLQRLIAFFNMHAGQYSNFGFLDVDDNEVIAQPIGVGDGQTTSFQLTRSLTFGGASFTEPVRQLLGAPTILAGNTPINAFTMDATGMVTFATAPAAGQPLTWSGRFLFLVRFAQDDLDLAQMMDGLWSQDGLTFVTDRL